MKNIKKENLPYYEIWLKSNTEVGWATFIKRIKRGWTPEAALISIKIDNELKEKMDEEFFCDPTIRNNFRIFRSIGKKLTKKDLTISKRDYFMNKGIEPTVLDQAYPVIY